MGLFNSVTFTQAIATPLDTQRQVGENLEILSSEVPEVAAAAERESTPERRRGGHGIANGLAYVPGWWDKVDLTPSSAHRADLLIPRGPYPHTKDATAVLKRLAIAEGRGIKTCTRRHSSYRSCARRLKR